MRQAFIGFVASGRCLLIVALVLFLDGCGSFVGPCTDWDVNIELLSPSLAQNANSLTGDLEIAGSHVPFSCGPQDFCNVIPGGVLIYFITHMAFDLEHTDSVVVNAQTADGTVILTNATIPIGNYHTITEDDSMQVGCAKSGQRSF